MTRRREKEEDRNEGGAQISIKGMNIAPIIKMGNHGIIPPNCYLKLTQ